MDLINRVLEAIETDEDGDERQSERIERIYSEADEATQKTVNNIFIALCGYSLKTLIEQ